LLNRLPTKTLQTRTPFEAWFGYKPMLINLKIFGCLYFSYIPQNKRDKLEKKVKAGIFVGYNVVAKAYKIYIPQRNKVIISRDVQFFESDNQDWKDEKQIEDQDQKNEINDELVRGTGTLVDIYQRCNVATIEPANYEEAATDQKWLDAMKKELKMIEKNKTWELVDRPQHKKAIGVKWIFRTKLNFDGFVNKYKAGLVVKGYAPMFGVDFSETFALVARLNTIRLALAAQKDWTLHQMDAKSVFLNGYLEEEIFVEQPEGFSIA
jgi:hypothetical protein